MDITKISIKRPVAIMMVMFIIIAVAAGVAGLLYIFAKSTLLPEFQSKVTELLNNWFNHA